MQKEEFRYAEELQENYHIKFARVNHQSTAEEFEMLLKEMEGQSYE